MFPPEFPEVQTDKDLKAFLVNINKIFMELRRLLVDNYTVATCDLILEVIAGSSLLFYEIDPKDPKKGLDNRGDRGKKFKSLLADFYPWDGELVNIEKEQLIDLLYYQVRNPMSHSLSLKYPSKQFIVLGLDFGLDLNKVKQLEDSTSRPSWASATAAKDEYGVPVICLSTLYWGIHRMLHKLFGDPTQVKGASALAKEFTA